MNKPRIYIETSVVSYLTSRPSRDLIIAAHQTLTKNWWTDRADKFELKISELVLKEASGGDAEAARLRLTAIENLDVLTVSEEAIVLAERLVEFGPIHEDYSADALHIAICAVNGMDYLLTWNCKHLANAALRKRIENIIQEAGYAAPLICMPEELMEDENV